MASDRNTGQEPSRRRRQSEISSLGMGRRDFNSHSTAAISTVPRTQQIPPSLQYDPRNQPYLAAYEHHHNVPSQAITDNYRWEPSQPANQGQPTHSSISQPSYYPSGLAGHGSDGARSPHPPVSPYTPHSVDGLPGRLSNTLFEPPFPRHTGGHMGSPMIPNSFDTQQSPGQLIPSSATSRRRSSDRLDSRYQVQRDPRNFFKVGRVFLVLWHENNTEGTVPLKGGTRSLASDSLVSLGKYGEGIYSGIRRMVVFKEQGQCSWCFPVHTYSRQGVAKWSVDPSKHAIIYMEDTQPQIGHREPRMTKEPLEVTPATFDQRLDPMSRLNFGKIYTVEHNVKVLPVGKISERSMPKFLSYAKRECEVQY